MSWKFGAATDIGSRSEQQDRLAILHSRNGRRHLVVVADGMGGLQNGAQAAQILIDVASEHFSRYKNGYPYDFLGHICQTAHKTINDLPVDGGSSPGTTALLLFIDKQTAYWAHVGDSRLYHFRNGSFLKHTHDHSLLQLMVDKGLVEKDNAPAEMRNQLYMRLGGEGTPEPDFNESEVEDGDLFLLCSDGFWQPMQPDEMVTVLKQYPPDQGGPQYLVDLARQRSGDCSDNISLAVLHWVRAAELGLWQRFINVMRKRFCIRA
ncbi:MAG: PP2C family protein-serine/threonine phosphatase [Methylomicrobium sp.]